MDISGLLFQILNIEIFFIISLEITTICCFVSFLEQLGIPGAFDDAISKHGFAIVFATFLFQTLDNVLSPFQFLFDLFLQHLFILVFIQIHLIDLLVTTIDKSVFQYQFFNTINLVFPIVGYHHLILSDHFLFQLGELVEKTSFDF